MVQAQIVGEHALDIAVRLAVRRHAAEAPHRRRAGVVRRQRQLEIVAEAL